MVSRPMYILKIGATECEILQSMFSIFGFLVTQPVKRILLPDTLGVLIPSHTFEFISKTAKYPNIHFDFHAHNDYDLVLQRLRGTKSWCQGIARHSERNGRTCW